MPLVKMPLTGIVVSVSDKMAADERFMEFLHALDRRRFRRMRFRMIGKRGREHKEEDSQAA